MLEETLHYHISVSLKESLSTQTKKQHKTQFFFFNPQKNKATWQK